MRAYKRICLVLSLEDLEEMKQAALIRSASEAPSHGGCSIDFSAYLPTHMDLIMTKAERITLFRCKDYYS
jgi:hypothetical protein